LRLNQTFRSGMSNSNQVAGRTLNLNSQKTLRGPQF
jgi:hypothetical protein